MTRLSELTANYKRCLHNITKIENTLSITTDSKAIVDLQKGIEKWRKKAVKWDEKAHNKLMGLSKFFNERETIGVTKNKFE